MSVRVIHMSLHWDDVYPVVSCLAAGCEWRHVCGALVNATTAWAKHVEERHLPQAPPDGITPTVKIVTPSTGTARPQGWGAERTP